MKHRFHSLDIGMKINILRENNNKTYPCQVLDITKPDEMIISGPIKKSDFILVSLNETIKVFYYVENKGKYSFDAEIVSINLSSIYSLTIRKKTRIDVVQLREYYRLPTAIKVNKKYEIHKMDEFEIVDEICEAKDISGGGMRLYCNHKHNLGDNVKCNFNIDDSMLEVEGTIVRVEEIDSFHYKYNIGISFNDIDESDRDLIIRYIFEQQRILRGKGLI